MHPFKTPDTSGGVVATLVPLPECFGFCALDFVFWALCFVFCGFGDGGW
jgi:hypothetical protein